MKHEWKKALLRQWSAILATASVAGGIFVVVQKGQNVLSTCICIASLAKWKRQGKCRVCPHLAKCLRTSMLTVFFRKKNNSLCKKSQTEHLLFMKGMQTNNLRITWSVEIMDYLIRVIRSCKIPLGSLATDIGVWGLYARLCTISSLVWACNKITKTSDIITSPWPVQSVESYFCGFYLWYENLAHQALARI